MNNLYYVIIRGWGTSGNQMKWMYRIEVTEHAEKEHTKIYGKLEQMALGNAFRDGLVQKDGKVEIRKVIQYG